MSLHIKNTNPIKNHIITYKKYQSDLKNQIGIFYIVFISSYYRKIVTTPLPLWEGQGVGLLGALYPLSIT